MVLESLAPDWKLVRAMSWTVCLPKASMVAVIQEKSQGTDAFLASVCVVVADIPLIQGKSHGEALHQCGRGLYKGTDTGRCALLETLYCNNIP